MREPAVADVEEAPVAEEGPRERQPTDEMTDRIGVMPGEAS